MWPKERASACDCTCRQSTLFAARGTTRQLALWAMAVPVARAVELLRLVMDEVQIATVRHQVALSLFTDFVNYTTFKPAAHHEESVNKMLNQLVAWTGALKTLRKCTMAGRANRRR